MCGYPAAVALSAADIGPPLHRTLSRRPFRHRARCLLLPDGDRTADHPALTTRRREEVETAVVSLLLGSGTVSMEIVLISHLATADPAGS